MATPNTPASQAEQKLASLINGNDADLNTLKKEAIAAIDKYIAFHERDKNSSSILFRTVSRLLSRTDDEGTLHYDSNEASWFKYFIEAIRDHFMHPKNSSAFLKRAPYEYQYDAKELADGLNRLYEFFQDMEEDINCAYLEKMEIESSCKGSKVLHNYILHYSRDLEIAQSIQATVQKYSPMFKM